MQAPDSGNIVFRAHVSAKDHATQLVAYDLTNKAWYQTGSSSWETHRKLLSNLGIGETFLELTDEAFANGTRDAQFASIPVSLRALADAGFFPKVW